MAKPRTRKSNTQYFIFQIDAFSAKPRLDTGEVLEIEGSDPQLTLEEFIKNEGSYYYNGDTTFWVVVDLAANKIHKFEVKHLEIKHMNAIAKAVA